MVVNRNSLVSSACAMLFAVLVVPSARAWSTEPGPPAFSPRVPVFRAEGRIIPAGPPLSRVAVDAGDSCVVDIVLPYILTGTLSGMAEISYRIDVKGPCAEAAPGVFDETWIARGTFVGSSNTASFVYTADVKAGGRMRGAITLGQGLTGMLWVSGNLNNAQLEYRGFIHRSDPHGRDRTP